MLDEYSYLLPGEQLVKGDEFYNGVTWIPVTEFFIIPAQTGHYYRRKDTPKCNGDICSKEMCPCADKLDWTEKDEKSLNPPKLGALERMFALQRDFNERVGLYPDTIDDIDQQSWLDRICTALIQEACELRDSFQWKWWKKQDYNKQNAKVEVVDIFHFAISAAQVLGMTPEDLLAAYEKKNQVNHNRQNADYASNPNAVGGSTDCKHI